MPQDTLDPDQPRYVGIRTDWEVVDIFAGAVWQLTVRRKPLGGHWETVHQSQWSGVMMDLASTLEQDTVNAFLYGEPRDLARACASIAKTARRHQRRHNGG